MQGGRFLVVTARFNELVTRSLKEACCQTLLEHKAEIVEQAWVPGAFELPVMAARGAETGRFDAIICLGAVIRGDTPHFDYVAGQCASGLMSVSVQSKVPVVFGVLTTNTVEEALNRAGLKHGNKGAEAALGAMQMVAELKKLASASLECEGSHA